MFNKKINGTQNRKYISIGKINRINQKDVCHFVCEKEANYFELKCDCLHIVSFYVIKSMCPNLSRSNSQFLVGRQLHFLPHDEK